MSGWEERKEKSLQEKLKNFFGLGIGKSGGPNQHLQWKPKAVEHPLSAEILKELGPENTLVVRLHAMKELCDTVLKKHLQDSALETMVRNTIDLVDPSQSMDARHMVLRFYRCLIQGQFEKLGTVRAYFFQLIKSHTVNEDLMSRLDLFKALTDSGKVVLYFEEETGPFLLEWMPAIISAGKINPFLCIVINFIKYNAAYLDSDIIAGLVQNACVLSGRTKSEEDITLCLEMLDAFICYSTIPSEVLPHFVVTLCRIVNIDKIAPKSWKVMRHFLGTSIGQSGIFTICWLIQDKFYLNDYAFLRGAVFFMKKAFWGPKKVETLSSVMTAILPALLKSLESQNSFVSYEVVCCLDSLLSSDDKDKLEPTMWEVILRVVEKLFTNPEVLGASGTPLSNKVHEILSMIEDMYKENKFTGSPEQLFDIVDKNASVRPESSVMLYIDYSAVTLMPQEDKWIWKLNNVVERYFKSDTRSVVRVKVISILSKVVKENRHLYEKELIDQTVLPFLSNINIDPDGQTRLVSVKFLNEVGLECYSSRCSDLMEILGKVLCRQFSTSNMSHVKDMSDEIETGDIKLAAEGLIDIFKTRLFIGPPSHGLQAFSLLMNFVNKCYSSPLDLEQTTIVRRLVLAFFLTLRANSKGNIGVVSEDGFLKFSSTIICSIQKDSSRRSYHGTTSPPLLSPTSTNSATVPSSCELNVNQVFDVFITCLKEEKNWLCLKLVLNELTKLLCNKALVVCGGSSVTTLCSTLCSLILNKNFENLQQLPPRFTKTDFHSHIFPVLSMLSAYHDEMTSHIQRMLIKCLQQGLVSKCVKPCIVALSLCTLQMNDIMYKLLPEVLLSLSKISATVAISIPILEFLSNLIRLPSLYKSFVEDQYMSIFAIALPYTNPFKFHQYTVALAHHVIAMWFLKCRLPFRKDFVRYIMKGLRANAVAPFEEKSSYPPSATATQTLVEGAKRQRSGSLNDPVVRRIEHFPSHRAVSLIPNLSSSADNVARQTANKQTLLLLQEELLETCLDLFGRYCHVTISTLPKRNYLTEFLMEKGQSMSWLVGNVLVTITTSGPGNSAYKDALCEKCYRLCHPNETLDTPSQNEPVEKKRQRHRSAIQPSTRDTSHNSIPMIRDDLLLHHNQKYDFREMKSGKVTTFDVKEKLSASSTGSDSQEPSICSCWCPGWAEVLIRKPTGNVSWLMKIQNCLFFSNSTPDFPVPDFGNWFKDMEDYSYTHKKEESDISQCSDDRESLVSVSDIGQDDEDVSQSADFGYCIPTSTRSKSPLRRTSSSPDMHGQWMPKLEKTEQAVPSETAPVKKTVTLSPQASFIEPSGEKMVEELVLSSKFSPPSSPVHKKAKQGVLDASSGSDSMAEKRVDLEARSAYRGSPIKEDKCKTIPEEKHHVSEVKSKLKLDLAGINLPSNVSDENKPASPPPSAGIMKSRAGSKSPFLKKGSISPPPHSTQSQFRDRGYTVSAMTPVSSSRSPMRSQSFASRSVTTPQRDMYRIGMNPSFVFLQIYQNVFPPGIEPLLLPRTEVIDRAVNVLDHIPPYETHKIGVVYVGPGQVNNEAAILSNQFGSVRYKNFLGGLGTFVKLTQVDPKFTYVAGLDLKGQDGSYACSWQDDIMQVVFHVATLMPNRESDPAANHKKCHIGNDFVVIVYNNSGEDFNMSTLKGQFIYVAIIIEPSDFNSNIVTVKAKPELNDLLGHSGSNLISDESLALYVRQLALHANLASVVCCSQQKSTEPYITNWLERLRRLKKLKEKVLQEISKKNDEIHDSPKKYEDFTAYI